MQGETGDTADGGVKRGADLHYSYSVVNFLYSCIIDDP